MRFTHSREIGDEDKSTNSWTTTVDIEGFARNIRRTLSHKFASLHFYWINLLFEFWLSRDLSWSSALSIQNRRAVSFLSTDVAKHRQFVRWTLQHKLITVTNCIKQKRERGCKKKLHTYNASPLLIHRGERTSNRVDEFGVWISGNYLTSQDNVSHSCDQPRYA